MLSSSTYLTHFDPKVPLYLACDASGVGIGSVIFHRYTDGTERPIAYASKTLTDCETRYSQIEREALGIVYGVKKFHRFLYGRKFTLQTDHKPLISIFGSKKGIPVHTANRLQRWAILLMGYTYNIEYPS